MKICSQCKIAEVEEKLNLLCDEVARLERRINPLEVRLEAWTTQDIMHTGFLDEVYDTLTDEQKALWPSNGIGPLYTNPGRW